MWSWEQRTGRLLLNHNLVGIGYSGADDDNKDDPDDAKNNPELQAQKNVGPIPRGRYRIGAPFNHQLRGPYCLRLDPLPGTETFGRDGFLIHGDSIRAPGTASHGCIILARAHRVAIWESGDRVMEVVEGGLTIRFGDEGSELGLRNPAIETA